MPSITKKRALFEFAQQTLAVKKGDPAQVVVKRKGGSKGSTSLKLITEPGTGVHGKVYKDTNVTLEFADGETEKTVQVPTLDFSGKATDVYDFKVKLLHPDQGSLVVFYSRADSPSDGRSRSTVEMERSLNRYSKKGFVNVVEIRSSQRVVDSSHKRLVLTSLFYFVFLRDSYFHRVFALFTAIKIV